MFKRWQRHLRAQPEQRTRVPSDDQAKHAALINHALLISTGSERAGDQRPATISQMAEAPLRATRTTTPAHAPAPAPLAVVSPQFCEPHTVPLTVKKTIMSFSHGDFTVTDTTNGAVLLQVEGAVFSFRNRRLIRDASGQPLLTLQAKLYSMHDRWEVFRGDSTNASDLLFTVKRSSLWQLKREMDVFLAGNTAQQVCDFRMKGSYFQGSCAFYLGNSDVMIAQMNRKHTLSSVMLGNEFCVNVFPHVDYAFIAALVVILEDVNRPRK